MEERANVRIDVREAEGAAAAPRRRVTPDQRPQPGAVDGADPGTVHDQVPIAFGNTCLNRVLEFLSRPAFDQRLERRQDKTRSRAFPVARPRESDGWTHG